MRRGLRRLFLYCFASFSGGLRHGMRRIYIYAVSLLLGLRRGLRRIYICALATSFALSEHSFAKHMT